MPKSYRHLSFQIITKFLYLLLLVPPLILHLNLMIEPQSLLPFQESIRKQASNVRTGLTIYQQTSGSDTHLPGFHCQLTIVATLLPMGRIGGEGTFWIREGRIKKMEGGGGKDNEGLPFTLLILAFRIIWRPNVKLPKKQKQKQFLLLLADLCRLYYKYLPTMTKQPV